MKDFKKYIVMFSLCVTSLTQADITVISPEVSQNVNAQDYEALRQGIANAYNRAANDINSILAVRFEEGVPVTAFLDNEAPQEIYEVLNNAAANEAFLIAFFNPLIPIGLPVDIIDQ